MLAARLRAYIPGGAALQQMPEPLQWSAMVARNDLGSLTLTYSSVAAGGEVVERALTDGVEIAVEVTKGAVDAFGATVWTEPRGCRFVLVNRDRDIADPTKSISLTLPSYAWLLSKARNYTTGVYPPEHAQAGKRGWVDPTPGRILVDLMAENTARGGYAAQVTPVFSTTLDAAGATWPTIPNQAFDLGTDYASILDSLTAAGALDWQTQARGLYAWLPDAVALSPDLTTGTAPLTLHQKHVGAMPTSESIAEMVGRMYVRTDAGGVATATDPAVVGPWGVPEGFLQVGSVADETAAVAVGEAELQRVGKVRGQYTRDLVLTDDAPAPLLDYWPGCWIKAPGAGGALERLRVQSLTLTKDANGLGGSAVLNDRIVADDERRARNLSALAGGGTISAGGPPAPIAVDPEASRVPSTPTGLNATTSLIFDPTTGAPSGVLAATWNVVTTATDDGAIVISGYEFQYRIGASDWQNTFTPELSVQIPGLVPGDSGDARVRAVGARSTLPSAWSALDSFTVTGDVTPPSVPSVPSLISRLGMVVVAWDGLNSVGGAMEVDLARIEIAMDDSATPTTVVGTMSRAGMAPIPDQPIGENRQVRLRSVDTSGNTSAWSVVTDPIVVHGVTGPDLEADSVTANAILAGSLTGDLFAALMVISSMYTTSATGTGQRVEWDINGIRLYNSLDELRVNLPTDPSLDAYFQGEVYAEGLTVTGGATFRSTQNEFAPDSVIALAASVTPPVGAPNVTPFWSSVQLQNVVVNDTLGNFGLDMSQVQSACWNHTINQFHLIQKVPTGGARVWYYTIAGAYSTHWDLPDAWDVSSLGIGLDGEFRILYKDASKWWIYDYSRAAGSRDREYIAMDPTKRPFLMMEDGTNNIYITEIDTDGDLKTRRVTTNTTPVTVAATTVMTGIAAPSSGNISMVYRGNADFGVLRTVVSHRNAFSYRHFSSSGVYTPEWNFNPPATKVGGFWNPSTSQFYTVGADKKLYTHSTLIWTSSTLDTWHLGQTFRDSVGTTHETKVGAFRTFNPTKRAWQRVVPATVPYAGGADDPNQWRLYGKTGTAPDAIGTGTTLQVTGAYTVTQTDMGALLTTGGAAPPVTSNFPAANPARMQSAGRLPTDATKPIIDLHGDGFARLGTMEVSNAGVVTDTRDDSDVLTLTNVGANTASMAWRKGDIAGVILHFTKATGATGQVLGTLPAQYWPGQTWPVSLESAGANPGRIFVTISDVGVMTLNWYGTDSASIMRGSASWPAP